MSAPLDDAITGTDDPFDAGDKVDEQMLRRTLMAAAGPLVDVANHIDPLTGDFRPLPPAPVVWAEVLLFEAFTLSGGEPDLIYWNDAWWRWEGSHWKESSDGEIEAEAYRVFHRKRLYRKALDDINDAPPFNPDGKKLTETLRALRARVRVAGTVEPFQWFGRRPTDPDPADLIPCQNGLFNLRTKRLMAADRRFMATSVGDWTFDRTVTAPRFMGFVESVWPGDATTQGFFQEILGYMLSGDRSLQKIPALIGPPRSGKSLIARILDSAVGSGLYTALSTAQFAENFGLQGTIGKRVAAIPDLRLKRQVDHGAFAERLLTMSGEDSASIPQKHRADWRGSPSAKFIFAANELPDLRDDSGAIANRLAPLVFRKSFLGVEDPKLFDAMRRELAWIVNWAALGLARLRKRGSFELPQASRDLIATATESASPITAFVRERCELDEKRETSVGLMLDVYNAWRIDAGEKPANANALSRGLRAAYQIETRRERGPRSAVRGRVYGGIGIVS
ncbi:DNA primase family protein [Methylopila sp. M107]|uniref:DNA primase family protein n=1 Tax=Methylopila sp. M107 TaxID=1101190 RepID=UPI00035D2B61|nr:DNA primase family protein [Methylopila sp. M107]